MREAQHQGGVAAGPGRQPLGTQLRCEVALEGRDADELDARFGAGQHLLPQAVLAEAARAHLPVPARHAAEHHDQFARLLDHRPGRVLARVAGVGADDVGHEDQGRVVAVVALTARRSRRCS